MNALAAVADRLRKLNEQHPNMTVRACRVWWDDDLSAHVADVLHELPPPSDETWPLEELDLRCEVTQEALADVVAFAYCDFRDPSEVRDVLESDYGWVRLDEQLVAGA